MNNKRFSGLAGQEYDLWAKAVPHYDVMQKIVGQTIAEYFNITEHLFPLVLEFGCGTGRTTYEILSHHSEVTVDAIDNEEVMLDQAKVNLQQFINDHRCELLKTDILHYMHVSDFHTFPYLVMVSAMTMHNFNQQYRTDVLKRIYRALGRNGLFINADKYALDDAVKHQKSLDRQLEQFQKVAREENNPAFLTERTDHYLRDNEPDLMMKQQEAIDEMEKIGFKDIQIIFREQMEAILVARK